MACTTCLFVTAASVASVSTAAVGAVHAYQQSRAPKPRPTIGAPSDFKHVDNGLSGLVASASLSQVGTKTVEPATQLFSLPSYYFKSSLSTLASASSAAYNFVQPASQPSAAQKFKIGAPKGFVHCGSATTLLPFSESSTSELLAEDIEEADCEPISNHHRSSSSSSLWSMSSTDSASSCTPSMFSQDSAEICIASVSTIHVARIFSPSSSRAVTPSGTLKSLSSLSSP